MRNIIFGTQKLATIFRESGYMLEHLIEFLVGSYKSNFVMITNNQEMRDNQQERFLIGEKSSETNTPEQTKEFVRYSPTLTAM